MNILSRAAYTVITVILTALCANTHAGSSEVLYGLSSYQDLYKINQNTGVATYIGSLGFAQNNATSLASSPLTGNLVTFNRLAKEFVAIDRTNGMTRTLSFSDYPGIGSLDFDTSGTLFVADNMADDLATVNISTGHKSYIGSFPFSFSNGLAFDTGGNLFLIAEARTLMKVNPANASTSLVGALGGTGGLTWLGLAFDGQDELYVTRREYTGAGVISELYKVNKNTAQTSLIANITGLRQLGDSIIQLAFDSNSGDMAKLSLAFPVDGYQPYTAPISSVFDHSGLPYAKDGLVRTFTGEIGDCQYGIARYKAADGSVKKFKKMPKDTKEKTLDQACTELKNGVVGKNGYLYAYRKGDLTDIGVVAGETKFKTFPDSTTYMYYDGHPGYDYPVGSVIKAAAGGVLCLAKITSSSTGSGEWRNSSKCPYGKDDINTTADSWDKFHAFYIVHPNSGNLSTWYLHASNLDPTVLAGISAHGYADVSKGDVIATMGGYADGKQGAYGKHLHFEVRRNGSVLVDPYGWNGSPVLWE